MSNTVKVELRRLSDPDGSMWFAAVNGHEFPISAYEVGIGDDGDVSVMLVVPADAVTVGDSSLATPPPKDVQPVAERTPVSRWGAPGPDPRESIPGWKPEPNQIHINQAPGDGELVTAAVRENLRRNGGAAGMRA